MVTSRGALAATVAGVAGRARISGRAYNHRCAPPVGITDASGVATPGADCVFAMIFG